MEAVKRLFSCAQVTNKLMKLGCWLAFSLCMPIHLAVGPQSPERHCCNASMIIIAAVIIEVSAAVTGTAVLLSLRGKRCEVKHRSLSMPSTIRFSSRGIIWSGCLLEQCWNERKHWILNATPTPPAGFSLGGSVFYNKHIKKKFLLPSSTSRNPGQGAAVSVGCARSSSPWPVPSAHVGGHQGITTLFCFANLKTKKFHQSSTKMN